jgi:hypothetical protein
VQVPLGASFRDVNAATGSVYILAPKVFVSGFYAARRGGKHPKWDHRPSWALIYISTFREFPKRGSLADNRDDQENIVITVYEPDPEEWEPDFRRRKTS